MWCCFLFFFNDTATTEIYTLSLHDALPLSIRNRGRARGNPQDVVLYIHDVIRKLRFYAPLDLLDGRGAILAVQAARIVHQDNVPLHGVSEDGLQLRGKSLVVTLRSGPAT